MAKARVLVSDKLSDAGLEILKKSVDLEVDYKPGLSEVDLAEIIGGYDGLVIRSGSKVTAKVIERASKLRVIGRAGIGVDNVDVPAASKRGIIVMNTPTGNTVTTAEHAITLMLSLARKIPQATASMRAGKWEKNKFQGREVTDKVLGVIGLGNIGRIVAERAQGLQMKVIAFDPVLTAEKAASLGVELVTVDELFARAEIITVHAPLTPDTKGLLGEAAFKKMKKGVLIVNAARGGIVDEEALLRALESGHVGGAALDVFSKEPVDPETPLLKNENFICTPHLGASTDEAQERVALEIADQVAAYLLTGAIKNAVNVQSLPKDVSERLAPYTVLAKRLGKVAANLNAQRDKNDVSEVRVVCQGEPGEMSLRSVTNAAVAGYLERFCEGPVNIISAPYKAQDLGIKVAEARESGLRGYRNTVSVVLGTSTGALTVTGTLGASGEARIIGLDNYELDAELVGTTLVIYNEDKPGVIGAVGTLLGTKGVNVSSMQVGLDRKTQQAVSLWSINSKLDESTIKELKALSNVRSVTCIEL